MTKLSINLNKIALLRNQRDVGYPDPVIAGHEVLTAGAHGLTVHPRPDQRHIRQNDVPAIANMMGKAGWFNKGCEYNIEGYPSPDFLNLIASIRPHQVTLVPDDANAKTSDHGWRLEHVHDDLKQAMVFLTHLQKSFPLRIILFLDAEKDPATMKQQLDMVKTLGGNGIELYTEPYAASFIKNGESSMIHHDILKQFRTAADLAKSGDLTVNAGHDLTLANLPSFSAAIPFLNEVSIGHAFTADALWMGLHQTVKAYLKALQNI